MLPPFQCLLATPLTLRESGKSFILGASGSTIYSFNPDSGTLLSKWSHKSGSSVEKEDSALKNDSSNGGAEATDVIEPPAKRHKHSSLGYASDSSSAEIVLENGSKQRRRPKQQIKSGPAVSRLICTSNGAYVVAVTGEDKCIRVFQLLDSGRLDQLSERQMPKRPSTIVLTSDEATILCADKFGDVYALPLLEQLPRPPPAASEPSRDFTDVDGAKKENQVSSANAITVHTKRNLRALNNQMKFPKKTEKKTLGFDHQLLLGHVSLLTDLVHVSIKPGEGKSDSDNYQIAHREESYILTADRDEHIRVSRGLPQAHIIETYCLGHTEFVNKLCVPHWLPKTLISGGGDDFILVWDWMRGRLTQKVDLLIHVRDFARCYITGRNGAHAEDIPIENNKAINVAEARKTHLTENSNKETTSAADNTPGSINKIAISGLWAIGTSNGDKGSSSSNPDGQVIVTCEGVPALFIFQINGDGLIFREYLTVEGNVLDVAILSGQKSIVYSMDNILKPFSTSVVQKSGSRSTIGVYTYSHPMERWVPSSSVIRELNRAVDAINNWASAGDSSQDEKNALSERLYDIEHLRKRGQEEENQADTLGDDVNI